MGAVNFRRAPSMAWDGVGRGMTVFGDGVRQWRSVAFDGANSGGGVGDLL